MKCNFPNEYLKLQFFDVSISSIHYHMSIFSFYIQNFFHLLPNKNFHSTDKNKHLWNVQRTPLNRTQFVDDDNYQQCLLHNDTTQTQTENETILHTFARFSLAWMSILRQFHFFEWDEIRKCIDYTFQEDNLCVAREQ